MAIEFNQNEIEKGHQQFSENLRTEGENIATALFGLFFGSQYFTIFGSCGFCVG